MSAPPVISVITITLNDREGLASTAESLMEQDGLNEVEWVIVDGGSADGTLELAQAYVHDPRAPARTHVLEGPDDGIVDGMTRGAAVASGEYLQFLNSGDRYHCAGALATVLERVGPERRTTERPAWLYGQAQVVDAARRPVRPLHARRYSRLGHAYHLVRINHQAVFLRRDIMIQAGGFRAAADTALDFDLLLRVGRLKSPEVIDEVMIDYLEGGISQRAFSDQIRRVGAIRRDEFGLTGVTAAADHLFTHAFIAYSHARRILKRLAVATLGDRFLGWWGSRRIGSASHGHPGSRGSPRWTRGPSMTRRTRVTLTSPELKLELAPDLGGRILSLQQTGGREWMWRNQSTELATCRVGDDYDDHWVGGFDELFPNDAPTSLNGLDLPDHGELWSACWRVVEATAQYAVLETTGAVTGVEVRKELRLQGSRITIRYRLHNSSSRSLPYLFKLHPAIAVTEDCVLQLPGGMMERVDPQFSRILTADGLAWPGPSSEDVSICRSASSGLHEFVYVSDLPDGWCAVVDHAQQSSLRLSYPTDVFPYCWLFITYGGWRDHNVVVLEPCTNYPKDLHESIQRGIAPTLAPGQTRAFDVTLEVGPP